MDRGLFFFTVTVIAWLTAFSAFLFPEDTFGRFWLLILFVLVVVSPFSLLVLLFSTEKFKEIWLKVNTFKKILLVLVVLAVTVLLGFVGFFGGGVLMIYNESLQIPGG